MDRDILLRLRAAQTPAVQPRIDEDLLQEAITEIEMLRALVDDRTVAEIAAELHELRRARRSRSAVAVELAGAIASRILPPRSGPLTPRHR